MKGFFTLGIFVLFLSTASAQRLYAGVASVIDGDTVEIQGIRVRLFGVDALESAQLCYNAQAQRYVCGAQVANALAAHLAGRTVTCRQNGTDRYGRVLATCTVGNQAVGAGWSRGVLPSSTPGLRAATAHARCRPTGLEPDCGRGRFQAPWEWRRLGASARWQGFGRAQAARPQPVPEPLAQPSPSSVYYPNCSAVGAAGATPVYAGQLGYRAGLDRDRDGVACE